MDHLVLIIGSGSGFGECLAKVVPRRLLESFSTQAESEHYIHLVLVGRAAPALEAVARLVGTTRIKPYICDFIDLANIDQNSYDKILNTCQSALGNTHAGFSSISIIHNAGTVGNLSLKVEDYTSASEISEYFNVNLVSFVLLTSALLRWAKNTSAKKIYLIQISSLLAVKAYSNWGLYAAAKAARDQLFAVVATENNDTEAETEAQPRSKNQSYSNNNNKRSRVRVLSYAPGPLDNNLQEFVRSSLADSEQKQLYTKMFEDGQLVSMEASANVLMDVILADQFISGAHIDYYD